MPPKNKRRNINAKSQQLDNPEGQGTPPTGGQDNNGEQNHHNLLDDDNNVKEMEISEDYLDPISSSESTLTSTLSEEDEPEEVVVSASLNLGQNSPVQLKTTVESAAKESPSSKESESVVKSPQPKNNHDSVTAESRQKQVEFEKMGGVENNISTADDANSNQSLESQMPPTVTILAVRNTKVYLIGTAHFSTQSQEDVRKVVRLTQPNCIMLELCPSRQNILHLDEEMLLREAGDISLAKVVATMRSAPPGTSRVQSLLHLLLLSMSASLTKKLGMAPGGEFRAAVREAEKLKVMPNLLLGDRPFHITLSRAIASLTFMQKIKLGWQFLISSDDITKEEIEKCKERDLLEKMLSEMTGEFPSITEVFVNERDYFLAHTLFMSAQAMGGTKPDGEAVVVAVVGMGHVPGICRNFGKTNFDQFDIIGNPPPPPAPSVVKWMLKTTVKLTLYGAVGYGAYKLFNRVDIFKKFENGIKLGFVKIK